MGVIFDNAAYGAASVQKTSGYMKQQAYELRLTDQDKVEWIDNATGAVLTKEPDMSMIEHIATKIISWLPVSWLM
jgi:hypothetical protein